MNYIELQIAGANAAQQELLIALLADKGFEGFEETDIALKAFIKETEFDKTTLEEIIIPLNLNYTSSVIPQQNWNAQWEASFAFVGVTLIQKHQPIQTPLFGVPPTAEALTI